MLPAAKLLQLYNVQDACCDFLKTQLHPKNCLGIKALANLHGCMELLSSSESYIKQHFLYDSMLLLFLKIVRLFIFYFPER